ncbi:hypothetical protein Afe04nite_80910 [Asanoa ferruginea]|nr:hypothetical protein Afe04nite_80910 [Asanoa ferruginea]
MLAAAAVLALVTACAPSTSDKPATMPEHATTAPSADASPELAAALGKARAATAKYVADLGAAEADGYHIITKMMPGMGYHYLNPAVTGFDVTRPAILVYVKDGTDWQLGALEWVWPEQPGTPPLDGATYGSFDAACHYQDGTFVPAAAEKDCAKASDGGSPFTFWHPTLVTMHVWLWFHNPAGLFHGTNPLVSTSVDHPSRFEQRTG